MLKESGVVFIEYQPLAHPVFEGPGASNGCTGPAAAGLELYHGSSPLRLHGLSSHACVQYSPCILECSQFAGRLHAREIFCVVWGPISGGCVMMYEQRLRLCRGLQRHTVYLLDGV